MTDAIDTTAPQAGFHIESAKSWLGEAETLMDEALKHSNTTADALLNAALGFVREAKGNLDDAERSPPLVSSGTVRPDASATQAPPSDTGKTVRQPGGDTLSLAREAERLFAAAIQFDMSPETDTLLLEATRKFERLIEKLEAADQASAEAPPPPPPENGVDTLERAVLALSRIEATLDLMFHATRAEEDDGIDVAAPRIKARVLSFLGDTIKQSREDVEAYMAAGTTSRAAA